MNTLLFLLCVLSTDGSRPNNPTIYIDNGYIEINHFWGESNAVVDGKDVQLGYCIFDQILIWKYNPVYDWYEIIHWEMIPNGREKDRIDDGEEKTNHLAEIKTRKINAMKWHAWRQGLTIEDVVVHMDSPWMGERLGLKRPEYNFAKQKWEVYFVLGENQYKFVVPTLVETNTTFDPEVDYKTRYTIGYGGTKFSPFKLRKAEE